MLRIVKSALFSFAFLIAALFWVSPILGVGISADSSKSCIPQYTFRPPSPKMPVQVFVIAVPFPSVTDELSLDEIEKFWRTGESALIPVLRISSSTLAIFRTIWGDPSAAVEVAASQSVLDWDWAKALKEKPDEPFPFVLIPFEQIEPRWRMIMVDGDNPLQPGFEPARYALTVYPFSTCEGAILPESNFDPEKLTSLTLTGTTAMVRRLAFAMEEEGLLYPIANIARRLKQSDFLHISNEASFDPSCPPAVPLRREARFCSNPSYMELLSALGADIIELTGNHILDWGIDPFLFSLKQYAKAGMKTYGGGWTAEEGQRPIFIEHHGNRIALLGCNAVGPENILATATQPGAAPCDVSALVSQIQALKIDGWLPVVTFQAFEYNDHAIPPVESYIFYQAAEAGAVVVSGSQAHIPQGFAFVGDRLIHFGLGNVLFDQVSEIERDAFLDHHFFYDGRYIGCQLDTIRQDETMQPRYLLPDERLALLITIFNVSQWEKTFP